MRVLEAVGSGAVLLSDRLPGMEMILDEGSQFAMLGGDVTADVLDLLADPGRLQAMSDSALERAMGLHTYDHRVDELFDIATVTEKRDIPDEPTRSDLGETVASDVEVQRVAHLNAPELTEELPTREVWDAATLDPVRLAPGRMEAVAIRADDVTGLEDLMRAARRYIYIAGGTRRLHEFLESQNPRAVVEQHGDVTRVDLMAPSYRIMPFELEQT
jgi:hypothetical protein